MKSCFENLYISILTHCTIISRKQQDENICKNAGEIFQSSRVRQTLLAAAGWRQVSSGSRHRQEERLSLRSGPLDVSLHHPARTLQLSDGELPGRWRPLYDLTLEILLGRCLLVSETGLDFSHKRI